MPKIKTRTLRTDPAGYSFYGQLDNTTDGYFVYETIKPYFTDDCIHYSETMDDNITIDLSTYSFTIESTSGGEFIVDNQNGGEQAYLQLRTDEIQLQSVDSSNSSLLLIEANEISLNYTDGNTNQISVSSAITVTDAINSKGAVYAADYTANYTGLSIVHKAYVDEKLSSWLTGTLTGNVIVDLNTHDFDIQSTTSGAFSVELQHPSNQSIGKLSVDNNKLEMVLTETVGSTEKSIIIDSSDMIVTDSMDSKGLEYAADYTANYTGRSIVHDNYIDAKLSSWLTGTLTGNVTVDTDGSNFELSTTTAASYLLNITDGSDVSTLNMSLSDISLTIDTGTDTSFLYIDDGIIAINFDESGSTNQITVGSTITIKDAINSKGAVYNADYSSNYTVRSLPDIGYTDTHLIGKSTSIIDALNAGSGPGAAEDTYILTWDNGNSEYILAVGGGATGTEIEDAGATTGLYTEETADRLVGHSANTGTDLIFEMFEGTGTPVSVFQVDGLGSIFNNGNAVVYTPATTNTFVGTYSSHSALSGATSNTGVGRVALDAITSGDYNMAFGNGAGGKTTSGSFNLFIGSGAGYENLTDSNNTYIGASCGLNNKGERNIFIGAIAGKYRTADDGYLFINSYDRSTLAADLTDSIIVGSQSLTVTNQTLRVNAKLSVHGAVTTNQAAGDIVLHGGSLILKEITTPTADANYGKVYTKTDNTLYFQDGAGTEHTLADSDGTTGGSGSAGAGNQYIEIRVGANTYKVLHDGTV